MVSFSKNWNNKLDWGIIPTFRLYTLEKYEYYKKLIDRETSIKLNNKTYCKAFLWKIIPKIKLKDIPAYLKKADTGLSPEEFDRLMEEMYSRKYPSLWKGENTLMLGLLLIKKF